LAETLMPFAKPSPHLKQAQRKNAHPKGRRFPGK
jgi:hypothetical protein